jgi:hypothetical protein
LIGSLLLTAIILYLGALLFVYLLAERIIFQPQASSYRDSDRIVKVNLPNGMSISAIYLSDPNSRYTILYSHGNAEDIGQLLSVLEGIKAAGFSVFAYDYRGYGTSSGTPSEENTYQDEDAAYEYLVNTLGVASGRIIPLGRSIGGAPAVDLAYRRQVGGLIIESSFVTAYRVLTRIPLFPFDKLKNISKMKHIVCPVLVIHGKRDEVIPFWHGEQLFHEANEPKLSYWVDGAGHNDLYEVAGDGYARALRDFAAFIEQSNASGH